MVANAGDPLVQYRICYMLKPVIEMSKVFLQQNCASGFIPRTAWKLTNFQLISTQTLLSWLHPIRTWLIRLQAQQGGLIAQISPPAFLVVCKLPTTLCLHRLHLVYFLHIWDFGYDFNVLLKAFIDIYLGSMEMNCVFNTDYRHIFFIHFRQ